MPEWVVLAGAIISVLVQLVALSVGLKRWLETTLIANHLTPMQATLAKVLSQQVQQNGTIARHDVELQRAAERLAYLEGQAGQPLGSLKE